MKILTGKTRLDSEQKQDIEKILIQADISYELAHEMIDALEKKLSTSDRDNKDLALQILKEEMLEILKPVEVLNDIHPQNSELLMICGVNGSGKTTTIGKLANYYKKKKIISFC